MPRIALIQQKAAGNRNQNRDRAIEATRKAAAQGASLVGFAELAFDPFYPQKPASIDAAGLAEPIPGPTTSAFMDLARELEIVIVLNLFESEGDHTFDTSPVIDADGRLLGKTQMTHVPDYPCFHEKSYYTPGTRGAPVYDTAAGRIGVAICYDRHYPEYMRALGIAGAQLVLTPQAGAVGEWPDGLFEAEMRVAAFQNGYFTALCNRVGQEPGMTFAGESFVASPSGVVIARAGLGNEETLLCDVDYDEIGVSNAKRLFLPDRRPELYRDWIGN